MKGNSKLFFAFSVVAFAASLCSLVSAAAYQPDSANSVPVENSSASSAVSTHSDVTEITTVPSSTQHFRVKIIKIHNGSIAVFEESSERPIEILGSNIEDLPEDTKNKLNIGIRAATEEEYLSYIEDFS